MKVTERIKRIKKYLNDKSFEEFIFLVLIEMLEGKELIKMLERVEKEIKPGRILLA